MSQIVGADNPITPQMRAILKKMHPFELNQLIDRQVARSGHGNWAKTKLIQNLMVDGTYKGEYLFYQYIENPAGKVPITRYTKDDQDGIVKPYTVNVSARIPGLDSDTYQLMADMSNVSANDIRKQVVGENIELGNDLDRKIHEVWQPVSSLFSNPQINLSAYDGFRKLGYLFYQRNPDDFDPYEIREKLIESQYYLGQAPGNKDKPIMVPKTALSPFGEFDNAQVFSALNELKDNLDNYLQSKILGTIAGDQGSNIKVYLDTAPNNEGIAIWTTNLNINGTPTNEGIIPWSVVADHITFQNKMAMLYDFDHWVKSGQYKDFLEEVQTFEKEAFKDNKKMVLQRSLYQISPRFASGIWGTLDKGKIKTMFEDTSVFEPLTEWNDTANFIRAFWYTETEIGLVERDIIVKFMESIKPNSSEEEIKEALNTLRANEVSKMISSVSEIDLLSEGLQKYWIKEVLPRYRFLQDRGFIQPRK